MYTNAVQCILVIAKSAKSKTQARPDDVEPAQFETMTMPTTPHLSH